VLEAYCDESGIQEGSTFCVVAGWVASERNWRLFQDRWVRASGGVPFHGTKFFGRTPQRERVGAYKEWTDVAAHQYLSRLVDAIISSELRAIGSLVDVAAFNALSLDDRKWLTGAKWNRQQQRWVTTGSPDKPYYLGFIECLESAALHVKRKDLLVNFFFDQQHILAPWAEQFFRTAKTQTYTTLSKRLGSLTFRSKEGVGGLQAADLLAHYIYRRFARTAARRSDLRDIMRKLDPLLRDRLVDYRKEPLERRLQTQRNVREPL
jgi:hypothetical protein